MLSKVNVNTNIAEIFAGYTYGSYGYDGDGPNLATTAQFKYPLDCDVNSVTGDVLIADSSNYRVRNVFDDNGVYKIELIAGNGYYGYYGDGGDPKNAEFKYVQSAIWDPDGNILITDRYNYLIRKIDVASNTISTIAGTMGNSGSVNAMGDGGLATSCYLRGPEQLVVQENTRDIYVTSMWESTVRKITDSTGIIDRVVGVGQYDNTGSEGLAVEFGLDEPVAIGLTDDGMYITDWYNSRVIKYTSADQWATVVVPAWAAGRGGEWDWNSGLTFDGVRGIMYVAYYYQYKVKYFHMKCNAGYFSSTGKAFYDASIGVMACAGCFPGTYGPTPPAGEVGLTSCTNCTAGTYQPTTAATDISSCLPCLEGHYCPNGTGTPAPCPISTYLDNTGGQSITDCKPCDQGHMCPSAAMSNPLICPGAFYQNMEGQIECLACQPGRVSLPGTITEDLCIDPVPNFVSGFITLGLVAATILIYVSHGRFRRVAFLRRFRALNLVLYEVRNVESTLYDHIREFHVHDMLAVPVKSFFRQIKTIIWLSTTFIIILVMAAAYYVLSMIKVLFDAMIVMKNAQVPETGFLNKLEEIKAAFVSLNLGPVAVLLSPFAAFMGFLSTLSIDLDTVEVTCVGAQAPAELLVNCAVLGLIISILESDFALYQTMVFERLNVKMLRAFFTYKLKVSRQFLSIIGCIIAVIVCELRPIEKLLQFILSLLNFSSFVSHEQYFLAHAKTDTCDNVDGASNIDSLLAFSTSALFWYMMAPAVYTLSSVCVPHGDNVPEEYRVEVKDRMKNRTEVVKDVEGPDETAYDEELQKDLPVLEYKGKFCPSKLAEQLTQTEFSDIVEMFLQCDEDGSGTIDTEEMERLFNKMGIVASREKTQKIFDIADEDKGGEIDFDEFCNFIVMFKEEDATGFKYFTSAFDKGGSIGHSGLLYIIKMTSIFMPDLLMISIDMLWLNQLISKFGEQYRFHWKQILGAPLRSETHEEHTAWVEEHQASIPTYLRLCEQCFNELYPYVLSLFGIEDIRVTSKHTVIGSLSSADGGKPIVTKKTISKDKHVLRWSTNVSKESRGLLKMEDLEHNTLQLIITSTLVYCWVVILCYILPIGHTYSKAGRVMWSIVINKYWVFLKVCCGVWTDDALECYGLRQVHELEIDEYIDLRTEDVKKVDELAEDEELVESGDIKPSKPELISNSPQKKQFSVLSGSMHNDDDGIDWDNYIITNEQEALDLEMHECVQCLSGTRAIIIQMIPFLTLLSIFAVGISHTPIYCSQKARKYFPPFLITDAYSRGLLIERQETNHELSAHKRGQLWVIWIKAIVLVVKDSRLIQAMFGYVQFTVKVGIIFSGAPLHWLIASIVFFFPFMVIILMEVYIHTGRALGIVDEDLHFVYKFFGITIEPRDLSDLINDEFADEFSREMAKSTTVLGNDADENERIVNDLLVENEKLKQQVIDFYITTKPTASNEDDISEVYI